MLRTGKGNWQGRFCTYRVLSYIFISSLVGIHTSTTHSHSLFFSSVSIGKTIMEKTMILCNNKHDPLHVVLRNVAY